MPVVIEEYPCIIEKKKFSAGLLSRLINNKLTTTCLIESIERRIDHESPSKQKNPGTRAHCARRNVKPPSTSQHNHHRHAHPAPPHLLRHCHHALPLPAAAGVSGHPQLLQFHHQLLLLLSQRQLLLPPLPAPGAC
jgi:hypothetical protein